MVMVLMITIIMLADAYVSEKLRLACYVFSSYFQIITFVISCDDVMMAGYLMNGLRPEAAMNVAPIVLIFSTLRNSDLGSRL